MADEPDPVADLLKKMPLTQGQRADLWDTYHASGDSDALAAALQSLGVPPPVKAALWDLKNKEVAPPADPAAVPEAPPRTWGDTALDVAKGVAKGVGGTALNLLEGATQLPPFAGSTMALDALRARPEVAAKEAQLKQSLQATNAPQMVGKGLETAAEMAVPLGAAAEAIPTAAKAGAKFNAAMAGARTMAVDVNAPGQVALRIADMAQHGGGTQFGPGPVRQFIQYITDPKKPQMTYEVARDFASNISRLSSKELASVPPAMMREVGNLRVALNKAVADAAGRAGMGAEHAQAMNEFAKAMRIRDATDALLEGAKKGALYGVGGGTLAGAGFELGKKIASLWGGE
jgi:hypothetical protein